MTNEVKYEVHSQEMNPIGLHSKLNYFISSINMQSNKQEFSKRFISFQNSNNSGMSDQLINGFVAQALIIPMLR